MHLDHSIEINPRTRIGLFAVISTLPILASIVFFVAAIYFKAEATEARVDRQEDYISDQGKILVELKERTARMEAVLNSLANKQ